MMCLSWWQHKRISLEKMQKSHLNSLLSTQLDMSFPVSATILKLLISLYSYTILTRERKHNFILATVWSTLLSIKLTRHDSIFFILVYTVSVTSLALWSSYTNLLDNRSYTGFSFDCIAGKTFSSLLSLFVSLGSINHERLAQHPGEKILTTFSTWTLFLPDAWMGIGRSSFSPKWFQFFNKSPSF